MDSSYRLQPNEYLLKQEIRVCRWKGLGSTATSELILTNRNLVFVEKGVFKSKGNVFTWSLSQIKIYNDKPQVMLGRASNGMAALEVCFLNGTESFVFYNGSKKTAMSWVDAICAAIDGTYEHSNEEELKKDQYGFGEISESMEMMGEAFAAPFKVWGDMGKGMLKGLGLKKDPIPKFRDDSNDTVTKKCMSCSAPLTGPKGKAIKCKYCDTVQTL